MDFLGIYGFTDLINFINLWVYVFWVNGFIGLWMDRSVDSWVYGFMVLCVYGFMGL